MGWGSPSSGCLEGTDLQMRVQGAARRQRLQVQRQEQLARREWKQADLTFLLVLIRKRQAISNARAWRGMKMTVCGDRTRRRYWRILGPRAERVMRMEAVGLAEVIGEVGASEIYYIDLYFYIELWANRSCMKRSCFRFGLDVSDLRSFRVLHRQADSAGGDELKEALTLQSSITVSLTKSITRA